MSESPRARCEVRGDMRRVVAYVDNGKVVLKGDSPRAHGRKAEGPSKTFAQHMGKHFPYSNAERAIVSGARGRSQA